MKTHFLVIAIVGLLSSCTNTSEEDLIETTPLEDVVTYIDDVKSIIENNCINCHSIPPENGAPMSLLNYEQVKEAVENRDLIDRILTEDFTFLMPIGGPRLPQNLIDTVIKWELDGFINE